MKKLLLYSLLLAIFFSCSNSDNVVKIFSEGASKAANANSPEELSKITIEVKEALTKEGDKFGGNDKLTEEESLKVRNAKKAYDAAVELSSSRFSHLYQK